MAGAGATAGGACPLSSAGGEGVTGGVTSAADAREAAATEVVGAVGGCSLLAAFERTKNAAPIPRAITVGTATAAHRT